MKEDILEQLVDDYLQLSGYLTTHNVKFRPSETDPDFVTQQDSVSSDVDVIGFNPKLQGAERVKVVSCKSWGVGFNPKAKILAIEKNKKEAGREAWKGFRELVKKRWADALISRIGELTGSIEFTYVLAVTKLNGDPRPWIEYPLFKKNLRGNPITILTLKEILDSVYAAIKKTPASSEVGRLLQVMKASGWRPQSSTPKQGQKQSSQDRESGAAAAERGYVYAKRIGELLGARFVPGQGNECQIGERKVVIKTALGNNKQVGVTFSMLRRVDWVYAAWEKRPGRLEIQALPTRAFEKHMRKHPGRKQGFVHSKVFEAEGSHVAFMNT